MEIFLALTLRQYTTLLYACCLLARPGTRYGLVCQARQTRRDRLWQRRRLRKVCLSGRIQYKHNTAAGGGGGRYMSRGRTGKARLAQVPECEMKLCKAGAAAAAADEDNGSNGTRTKIRSLCSQGCCSYCSLSPTCVCAWKLFSIFVI